jgi:acyl-coenzyme A thioesterase PaaI-like protein
VQQPAFQEIIPDNYCWGCGSLNEHGLHVQSHWSEEGSVCTWQPQPWHAAGPQHILNGGIIATIIDCHCVCTAIAAAYRAEGREPDSEPSIWYATASLQVTYQRPTPLDGPVRLTARIVEATTRKTRLTCTLVARGEECARGEVVAVRVPEEWRQRQR